MTNLKTTLTSQKIYYEDTQRTKDSVVTKAGVSDNVTKTEMVSDNATNVKGKKRKKSKNKRKEDAVDGTIEKDTKEKELSKTVDNENSKINQNICRGIESSNNDNTIKNNEGSDKPSDSFTENNCSDEVNINRAIISKENDNALTKAKVNEAMEIVNDTLNTVNDAIKTVNEAIKKDGIDDLIHQMEDLTTIGSFNVEGTQQNSETGEIEVTIGKSKLEKDSQANISEDIDSKNEILSSEGNISKSQDSTFKINSKDIQSSNISMQLAVKDTENLDIQNMSKESVFYDKDIQTSNISNTTKQLIITEFEYCDTQNKSKEESMNFSKESTVLENENSESQNPIVDDDSQNSNVDGDSQNISKESVCCDKCFISKINGVCPCGNVNLYYQMLAKDNLGRSESKKSFSDGDNTASVDLSTAIALINR